MEAESRKLSLKRSYDFLDDPGEEKDNEGSTIGFEAK